MAPFPDHVDFILGLKALYVLVGENYLIICPTPRRVKEPVVLS
jgi:hypothetical protein